MSKVLASRAAVVLAGACTLIASGLAGGLAHAAPSEYSVRCVDDQSAHAQATGTGRYATAGMAVTSSSSAGDDGTTATADASGSGKATASAGNNKGGATCSTGTSTDSNGVTYVVNNHATYDTEVAPTGASSVEGSRVDPAGGVAAYHCTLTIGPSSGAGMSTLVTVVSATFGEVGPRVVATSVHCTVADRTGAVVDDVYVADEGSTANDASVRTVPADRGPYRVCLQARSLDSASIWVAAPETNDACIAPVLG